MTLVYHIVQAKLSALKTATSPLRKDQEQCIKHMGLTIRYIEELTISTKNIILISLIFSEPRPDIGNWCGRLPVSPECDQPAGHRLRDALL